MKYVLLNRANIVVDILEHLRYIELLPSTNMIIACAETEGTGIIGSDDNTHYILAKADMTNNPDAITILAVEELSPEVAIGKTKYNPETKNLEPRYTLEEIKVKKQEENKKAFADYLDSHPMIWTDGKEYGITQDDQNEINFNLAQYQFAIQSGGELPALEWHARHEENVPWTLENLTKLSLAINEMVYPRYHQMQEYKTQIFNATSPKEVEDIKCIFGIKIAETE